LLIYFRTHFLRRGELPMRGGVGNPVNTQDNSTGIVSNYENNTCMGMLI